MQTSWLHMFWTTSGSVCIVQCGFTWRSRVLKHLHCSLWYHGLDNSSCHGTGKLSQVRFIHSAICSSPGTVAKQCTFMFGRLTCRSLEHVVEVWVSEHWEFSLQPRALVTCGSWNRWNRGKHKFSTSLCIPHRDVENLCFQALVRPHANIAVSPGVQHHWKAYCLPVEQRLDRFARINSFRARRSSPCNSQKHPELQVTVFASFCVFKLLLWGVWCSDIECSHIVLTHRVLTHSGHT